MEVFEPVLDFLKNTPSLVYLYYIVLFIVTLTLLVVISKSFFDYILLPLWRCGMAVYNFFIAVDTTMNRVTFIEKELKPNGGSTIKDQINFIKKELSEHSLHMKVSDEKQRIILNSIGLGYKGIGFFETNTDGECLSITPKYCELSNLAEEEILGYNWILAIHPEDKDNVLNEWNSCTRLKRVFKMRYRYLNRKNNIITNIECTATPIKVDDKITGFLGTIERIE